MKKINTIDLWTEQYINHQDCCSGAFVDGMGGGILSFNRVKVIHNCNCIITCSEKNIPISNKHQAIVFYLNSKPIRLAVFEEKSNLDKMIKNALKQNVDGIALKDLFSKNNITIETIDLKETPVKNQFNLLANDIDVGSCDRFTLLLNMLEGCYTESESEFGNFDSNVYLFNPKLKINYYLKTDCEEFVIEHEKGFINDKHSRVIPIQKHHK